LEKIGLILEEKFNKKTGKMNRQKTKTNPHWTSDTGWVRTHKVHKSKKDYNRKSNEWKKNLNNSIK
jgi:hypothetical protein